MGWYKASIRKALEYKCSEQYTETHSTESAEQQTRELYEHMVTTISRIIPKESIEEMIKYHSAIEAEAKGLVDGLYYTIEEKA